jgi:hypothetical protein
MHKYITRFAVKGEDMFPLEMLQHCRCYPTTPESVDAIHASIRGELQKEHIPYNLVQLEFTHEFRDMTVWLAREKWESFGWHVEGYVKTLPLTPDSLI